MYFGLGRRGWPKLIVRWCTQSTLDTFVQVTENDEPILQRIVPPDVGFCIIDYDKLHGFFKEDECALSLWHAGVEGQQIGMTSTKIYSVLDVPLHIRLAAEKVDVEQELRRLLVENSKCKCDEQPNAGGKDWKRQSSFSSPPWRSRQSWDSNDTWNSDSWKGTGRSWKENGCTWKGYDSSWKGKDNAWKEDDSTRDWSWASSDKRSRRW